MGLHIKVVFLALHHTPIFTSCEKPISVNEYAKNKYMRQMEINVRSEQFSFDNSYIYIYLFYENPNKHCQGKYEKICRNNLILYHFQEYLIIWKFK